MELPHWVENNTIPSQIQKVRYHSKQDSNQKISPNKVSHKDSNNQEDLGKDSNLQKDTGLDSGHQNDYNKN